MKIKVISPIFFTLPFFANHKLCYAQNCCVNFNHLRYGNCVFRRVSEKTLKMSSKQIVLFLFSVFHFTSSISVAEFSEFYNALSNPKEVCQTKSSNQGKTQILSVVDCDQEGAVSNYDLKVRKCHYQN